MDGVSAVGDGTLFATTMTKSRLYSVFLILAVVMMVVPHGITTEPELKSLMNVDGTVDHNTRWPASEIIHNDLIYNDAIYGLTQEEASLLYLWKNYKNSSRSERAIKEIQDRFAYMASVDKSVDMIGFLLFGPQYGRLVIDSVREPGQPVVDDWDCYKSMVGLYEKHCGMVTDYSMKRVASFAKICSHLPQGVAVEVEEAFKVACSTQINIPYDMGI